MNVPNDSEALTGLCVVAGMACAILTTAYGPLRHAVTAVHEAGHALVALLCGRTLRSIRLNSDSSGETVSVGRSSGPGVVLTLLAGYPAPSVVGMLGLWAVHEDRVAWWLIALLVVLGGTLLLLRNAFGVLVTLGALAVVGALVRWASPDQARAAAVFLSVFLLGAGLRGCLELLRHTRGADDAVGLARVTPLPAWCWRVVFLGMSIAAVAVSLWRWGPDGSRVASFFGAS